MSDAPHYAPPQPTDAAGRSTTLWRAAACGLVAGALTVAVAEFLTALLQRTGRAGGTPSPVLAFGGAFIDRTPPWLKEAAIATFGTHDKTALLTGMALVVAAAAAGAGVLAARWRVAGLLLVVGLGAVAGAAVLSRPGAAGFDVFPTLAGAAVGLMLLSRLLSQRQRADASDQSESAAAVDRRSFLVALGGSAALAVIAGGASQVVGRAARVAQASRAALRLPTPRSPGPSAAELVSERVPGISPLLTAPRDFYRIDTALSVPQLDADSWRLRVHGLVEQELEVDLAELLTADLVERMITLTCVSNEVGDVLVGNQTWLGYPLRDLLARARPRAGADMVLSTSADGWTAGTPLSALTDPGRDALLAVGMAGAPLPVEHGFPVRMVVPGLYGYVSATKWLVDLEVTRFDRAQGYWTPRGWSALGPIKTASRIDVPRAAARVAAGRATVAGVAWAQHRGVAAVQVRVDEGAWQPARLGTGGTVDSWRQWVYEWSAAPGEHTLQVRAVDGRGEVQTGQQRAPAPDGSTGWHTVQVTVG